MTEPLQSAVNVSRLKNGMFGPGNQCSKGNPTLKRMAQLREEVFRAETPARSIEVLNAMYAMYAMAGAAET